VAGNGWQAHGRGAVDALTVQHPLEVHPMAMHVGVRLTPEDASGFIGKLSIWVRPRHLRSTSFRHAAVTSLAAWTDRRLRSRAALSGQQNGGQGRASNAIGHPTGKKQSLTRRTAAGAGACAAQIRGGLLRRAHARHRPRLHQASCCAAPCHAAACGAHVGFRV